MATTSVSLNIEAIWAFNIRLSVLRSAIVAWQYSSDLVKLATCTASWSSPSSFCSRSMITSSFHVIAATSPTDRSFSAPFGTSSGSRTATGVVFVFANLLTPLVFTHGEVVADVDAMLTSVMQVV